MRVRNLRAGDVVAGVAGAALIGFLFAPWYATGGAGATSQPTVSAWSSLTVTLAFLLLIALLGLAVFLLTAFERTPALPVVTMVFTVVLGVVAVALAAYRVASSPEAGGVRWGAWAGLLCAILITWGAWRSMRQADRPNIEAP